MKEKSMGCGKSSLDKTRNNTQLVDLIGSPGWTRTNDQRINSPTLYQLSYRGVDGASFTGTLGWALQRRRILGVQCRLVKDLSRSTAGEPCSRPQAVLTCACACCGSTARMRSMAFSSVCLLQAKDRRM